MDHPGFRNELGWFGLFHDSFSLDSIPQNLSIRSTRIPDRTGTKNYAEIREEQIQKLFPMFFWQSLSIRQHFFIKNFHQRLSSEIFLKRKSGFDLKNSAGNHLGDFKSISRRFLHFKCSNIGVQREMLKLNSSNSFVM